MDIQQLDYEKDEAKRIGKCTLLVDGVEHVIMSYYAEYREVVYRNNVEVFPAYAEKIIAAYDAETSRALDEMSAWVQAQDWYSD